MNETETPAGVVHHFPGAPNRANLTLRSHPRKRKPATINRLKSVISSMRTYAQRRRLMPKGG